MTIPAYWQIPEWDEEGFLPHTIGQPTLSSSHPPYLVRLKDLVSHYSYSAKRQKILKGFLDFREALHQIGLWRGIQWINGSFVNDKMLQEGKEPGDIDVVTLYYPPGNQTQITLLNRNPALFRSKSNKANYLVDSYFIDLNTSNPFYMTKNIAFWNNLWHHTEEGRRKGFLAVNLSGTEDQVAMSVLEEKTDEKAEDE